MYSIVNQIIKTVHHGGKIERKENSHTKEIGIRAIINKRQAIISTTNFDQKNINSIIDKVFEMAKVVPKNEYCGLANTYEVKKVDSSELSKLKLVDKKYTDEKNHGKGS